MVNDFIIVTGHSKHLPVSPFYFTSFSHVVFKQDENAYIFHIHIPFSIFIFIIKFHIQPIHPIQHPSNTCNFYESLECTGNLKTLECTDNIHDLNTLIISTTFECTDDFYNFCTH